jgi:hypothetical protein
MSLFSADLLRSGFLSCNGLVLWLSIKERFAQNTAILIVGLLMVSDLFFVDKKCFGKDFVSRSQVEVPFQESPADAGNTKRYFKLPCFLKLAISWERELLIFINLLVVTVRYDHEEYNN